MSIVSVVEQRGRERKIGQDFKREYKRVFLVITNDKSDDGIVASLAVDPNTGVSIPGFGNVYNNGSFNPDTNYKDFGSYCTTITASEKEPYAAEGSTGSYWEVTCEYNGVDPAAFDAQNPLEAPPQVQWSFNKLTEPLTRDLQTGKAVKNSAGDYFDPPLEKDDSRPVLRIKRKEATYDPVLSANYKDAINQDTFWGFPAQWVKLNDRSAALASSGDCPQNQGLYWEVDYEFEINSETWVHKPLDQGLKELANLTDDDGNPYVGKVNILDDDKQPVNSPEFLDGNGMKLPVGSDPIFLQFNGYNVMDFDVFNLILRGP